MAVAELDKTYDIWFSDGNDRYRTGKVAISYTPEYHESDETLAWRALDLAIEQECRPEVIDKLEFPYMDACAVYDFHDDDCECSCHAGDDGDDSCGECWGTECISVEER
jgi:hypothetical protein